jgi:hypothetical protein
MKAIEDAEFRGEAERIAAMSSDEVDAELRAEGGDPAKIRARGAALAAKLLAERTKTEDEDESELPWAARARERLEEVRRMANEAAARKTKLPRVELMARVNAARNSPRFAQPVASLFRKRTPEQMSDEELEATLESLGLLADIEGDGKK